ncbi:MAG: hypothetical protein WBD34_07705 [Burkholderiaceae bacterium]
MGSALLAAAADFLALTGAGAALLAGALAAGDLTVFGALLALTALMSLPAFTGTLADLVLFSDLTDLAGVLAGIADLVAFAVDFAADFDFAAGFFAAGVFEVVLVAGFLVALALFLAAGFLAAVCLEVDLLDDFLVAATLFFAAGLLAAAFFVAGFFVAVVRDEDLPVAATVLLRLFPEL